MSPVKTKMDLKGFTKYEKMSSIKASDSYILQIAVNNDLNDGKIAAALSTRNIEIFDVLSSANLNLYKGHNKPITSLKFSSKNPNILFSSSRDGEILVWDNREGDSSVQKFFDDTDGALKPFTCFDIDPSEEYLCAGTEIVREDAFLIFWDLRSNKNLGGYWNSHTDEITQVNFHEKEQTSLASSSVDGLINIYDLSQMSEDDSLQNTINVETSINGFCWSQPDAISCITSTEDYQFWNTNDAKPSIFKNRKNISEDFEITVDYLIETFNVKNKVYLATGTNNGSVQIFSCSLDSLKAMYELEKGHQDVIRTVNYYSTHQQFVTGGEDGNICLWDIVL